MPPVRAVTDGQLSSPARCVSRNTPLVCHGYPSSASTCTFSALAQGYPVNSAIAAVSLQIGTAMFTVTGAGDVRSAVYSAATAAAVCC